LRLGTRLREGGAWRPHVSCETLALAAVVSNPRRHEACVLPFATDERGRTLRTAGGGSRLSSSSIKLPSPATYTCLSTGWMRLKNGHGESIIARRGVDSPTCSGSQQLGQQQARPCRAPLDISARWTSQPKPGRRAWQSSIRRLGDGLAPLPPRRHPRLLG
jgi:hypothetical protein